jgi:hypothetical protein
MSWSLSSNDEAGDENCSTSGSPLGATWVPYVAAHKDSSCCIDLAASADFIVLNVGI